MRPILLLIFALSIFGQVSHAKPVEIPAEVSHAKLLPGRLTLNFDKVPVVQLLQSTYRNMLGKDYIIDPMLTGDSRLITLSVKDLPKDKLKSTVDTLLAESGIAIKTVGGIPYFYPANKYQGTQIPAAQNDVTSPAVQTTTQASASSVPTKAAESSSEQLGPVRYEEVRFYEPRYRLPEQMQQMANPMLGTQFAATDRVTLAGTIENVERVQKILEQFDSLPPEITAKALVFEFSESKTEGSTFQLALNILSGKLTTGFGGPVATADNFVRFKGKSIDAVLSAVSGDGRFKLVSAPSIRVRDGAKGRITVGQDVPVLADAQLDKSGNPVQSVQYRPSGVIFEISPRIMRDRIELNLSQQLSNFQQTNTSKINSPTLTKREVSTVVGIESGDMIVLGGLDEKKDNNTRQGLSFLPRLLDSTSTETTNTQVLVVLLVTKIIPGSDN